MPEHEAPAGEGQVRLCDFMRGHHSEILGNWERTVRSLPVASRLSRPRLIDHMPDLLERIAAVTDTARSGRAVSLEDLPEIHALERLDEGFDLEVVAAEYAMLRECVLRLYRERCAAAVPITEAVLFNRAIDDAIIASVARYTHARQRTLVALDRISEAALESGDMERFLPRLLRVLLETTEAVDSAVIFLREGDTLRVRAAVGTEEMLGEGFSLKMGEGFAGKVAADRRPMELRAASTHPLVKGELTHSRGIRALYGVPLVEGDTVIGVAKMGSRSTFEFSIEDKLLFRTMAHRVSALILQAHLRERERAEHTRAEESLALVDTLLANAPVGIAVLDPELRHLRINEELAVIQGVPVESYLGCTVGELLPPEHAAKVETALRQVLATGRPVRRVEFTSRPESTPGEPRHHLADYFPVRTPDGRMLGVGCLVTDITERKQAEQALRTQRDLLESLLQAQSDLGEGFVICDGLKVVYANAALGRMLGYSQDELLTLTSIVELVVAEARPVVEDGAWRSQGKAGPATEHHETAAVHRAGFRVELEVAVKHLDEGRTIALVRDITERKQAQRDREQLLLVVQTEQRRLEAVLESLPVGVLLAEAPSGRIVRGNGRVEEMVGHLPLHSQDVEHYHEWKGFHLDGRPYENQEWPLARALLSGLEVRGQQIAYQRPDGRRVILSVNASPVRREDGTIVAAVAAFDDITERIRAQEELTRSLAFRDQLIGILGHDLRNPLGAIKMSAGLVLRRGALPEGLAKAVARIDQAAERMARIIDELLDFTHSRFKGALPISPVPSDLHELCRATVDELAVIHPHRRIEVELEGNGRGTWDPIRMGQLISNLVGNALQYGDEEQPVRISVFDAGEEIGLEVTNGGPPIHAELLPRLFEPFQRGPSPEEAAGSRGLGLGLYIVRQIIAAHGGSIEVRSTREESTTFAVRLPRQPPAAL